MNSYTLDARTATPHYPGIGRYVRSLADHMPAQLSEDERLVLLVDPNQEAGFSTAQYGHTQVAAVSVTASPFSVAQQWTIPRLLRRQLAVRAVKTLYHSPYYLMPYTVPYPTVVTLYDVISLTYPRTVSVSARALFRITTSLAIRTSQRVITISDAARRDLLAHFDVDPARIVTIQLAAGDAFHPAPASAVEAMRDKHRLYGKYLLYLGSNKPHKNIVRLVDAYALAHGQATVGKNPLPTLVIAGAWDERYPEAKARTEQLGLAGSVRFLGPVEDASLPALYSAATAFIFPSRHEGFGLPVLEAMACGAPVACGHTSSLPEVAGDAAYYVDPEDSESIAQAIRALSADAHLRHTLSESGLRHARRFSWKRTASETLSLYRELLRTGKLP